MMTVGQNPKLIELGKIRAELNRLAEWIESVRQAMDFAERYGMQDSIKTIHQPMKDRLLAEYASLARQEKELFG